MDELSRRRGANGRFGQHLLQNRGKELGLLTITDIHVPTEAEVAAKYVDFLQIPAFLCRQTDLLLAAAATKKIF